VEVAPGALLVAPPSADTDTTFGRTVIVIVDCEPNGITTGIAINRVLETRVIETSALALLFVPEPDAHVFWGGPMGTDPAILAQFSAVDGLEWFHLPIRQQRPFPVADVGVIAVAEHPEPFEGRIQRARVFVGLCVWHRGQLQAELNRDVWRLARSMATAEELFSDTPDRLWAAVLART
jgi:putative AlgH/UPF0301 family transcriptional regulator